VSFLPFTLPDARRARVVPGDARMWAAPCVYPLDLGETRRSGACGPRLRRERTRRARRSRPGVSAAASASSGRRGGRRWWTARRWCTIGVGRRRAPGRSGGWGLGGV